MVFFDITMRKRAEDALERSRQGLSRLAEASLRVVRETDLQRMLQAISEAALALTGARTAVCGHGYVGDRFRVGGSARVAGAPACPPGDMFLVDRGGGHMALVEGSDRLRLTDAELRAHPRWWGGPVGHVPLRGLLGVRMVGRNAQTSGVILVSDRAQGDFTEEDESLLLQLGTIASLALQHVEARVSLEESDRSKNGFLAMLSHELRNPLAPIRNSLHILARAAPGSQQAQRAQAVIDRQVVHLTCLVDDLLDVTRISRGKVQLRRERLDVAEVVQRAVEDHRASFANNGIALELSVSGLPLWTNADRTRLAQVFGNLLENSAKFTQGGGRAAVTVAENAALRQAIVRVVDDGAGIPREMLPRVFEPFTQADTTLDRSKGGLGLGLALVRGLVEIQGARSRWRARASGRGPSWWFCSRSTPRRSPRTWRSPRAPIEGRGACSSSTTTATPPRRCVTCSRCAATASTSPSRAREAIEAARALRPDVVLCDIGLPRMDGYAVARAFRADPALRGTRLVALTGYAAPDDVTRARSAGFDAHAAKPPAIEKVEEALATAATAPRPGCGRD